MTFYYLAVVCMWMQVDFICKLVLNAKNCIHTNICPFIFESNYKQIKVARCTGLVCELLVGW